MSAPPLLILFGSELNHVFKQFGFVYILIMFGFVLYRHGGKQFGVAYIMIMFGFVWYFDILLHRRSM